MEKRLTIAQEIAAILTKQKAISEQEGIALQKAFKDSSKDAFDDFLIEEGLVDEQEVLKALATYYQVPAFDVVGYFFDHSLLIKFPKDFLLRSGIIPLEVDENILIMISSDPSDPELLPAIGNFVSYDIQFRVGLRRDICDAVKEFYDRAVTEVVEDEDIQEELREERQERKLEQSPEDVIPDEDVEEGD